MNKLLVQLLYLESGLILMKTIVLDFTDSDFNDSFKWFC